MLTIREYQILNACADDVELFYAPFAEVNYGGQVFPRANGEGYAQYEDEKIWVVKVPAEEIVKDIVNLVLRRLLECWRLDEAKKEKYKVRNPDTTEFSIYQGYDCLTFEDHINRFGYGQHEFKTTEKGIAEILKPIYGEYDEKLGVV
jgi:hypothetical protein